MPAGQIVLFVVGTVIIVFGAYYVTYYVGVKSTKLRRGAGRSIILRDRFSISKDKSFCLVEICGKVYVVGVTNHAMTLLDTLKPEDLTEDEDKREQQAYQNGAYQNNIVGGIISFIVALIDKWRFRNKRESAGDGTFAERLKTAISTAEKNEGEDSPPTAETQEKATPLNPEEKE